MNFAVDIGEDGSHFRRGVGHNEVPGPLEKTFAGLHIAGLGGDKVASLSEVEPTKSVGRDICSSHLIK